MLKEREIKIDNVLNFAIHDSILEERITGRWIHPSSGRTYHTKFSPPKVPGVDDVSPLLSECFLTLFSFIHMFKKLVVKMNDTCRDMNDSLELY